MRSLLARSRRPLTVLASVAVMAGVYLPVGPASDQVRVRRVVATPVPVPAFVPVSMAIPKIDLEAPIVPVQTEPDGKMGSPKTARDVGWWEGRKAGKGNVLLAAHHDWNGALGSFYRLGDLEKGDQVIVRGDGKALTYRIVWVKNYDRNTDATELLGNDNGQVATLITCGGVFDTSAGTHAERIVARASLVSA